MIRPIPSSVHFRFVEETFHPGGPGFWCQPEWRSRLPWVAQGTSGAPPGASTGGKSLALFGDYPAPGARTVWRQLASSLGFPSAVLSPQVHGSGLLLHGDAGLDGNTGLEGDGGLEGEAGPQAEPGTRLLPAPEADGHLTRQPGVLLGVTVADCTPVFLADPRTKSVGLLHAGWRGVAAGIVERGLEMMRGRLGSLPRDLHMHLGPAICGNCYEVGPEVFEAVGLPAPAGPTPLDLRRLIAGRARSRGVSGERISISSWCTLCGESPFFSHRRGDRGRQAGFLGIHP